MSLFSFGALGQWSRKHGWEWGEQAKLRVAREARDGSEDAKAVEEWQKRAAE
jgi:hypothetical protein